MSSGPCSDRLTKYTGFFSPSLSTTNTEDMASFEVERYTCSISPGMGLANVGNLCRASLIFWSANSASAVHWKLLFSMQHFNVWNSGMALSADFDINLLSVVSFPFSPYASLKVFGGGVSMNSSTFTWLGWIPCLVT